MEDNININDLIEIIKRKWKIVAITTAIFVIIAIILSFFIIKPKYETNVKLFIGKGVSKHSSETYDNNEVMMYQNLLDTYANVIQTQDLVSDALQNINVNLKPEEVLKNLNVTPVANTQILEISYRDTNRERAVNVIDSITKQFIKKSKVLIPNGNVQVLETASYPKGAVSPHKKINILIGFILGVAVGIMIVFILEALDNTFKVADELEKKIGVPVIGIITEFDEKNGRQVMRKNGARRKK
ncbi:MAG: YveK family protein [Clostridium sp.]